MTQQLPPRASLEWLRKTAKQNLVTLQAEHPGATLADAQLALARDYGFPSWRALKAHVEAQPSAQPSVDDVAAAFLRLVGDGEIDRVRAALAAAPGLANIVARILIGAGGHRRFTSRSRPSAATCSICCLPPAPTPMAAMATMISGRP